jgi:hypothetical protein
LVISPTLILATGLIHVGERAIRVLFFDLFRDICLVGSGHGDHKFAVLAVDFNAFGDFIAGSFA